MSKSIDDYRNIIKILKLQLLKVREENSELSHTLGIATENETSCMHGFIQPSRPRLHIIRAHRNSLLRIFLRF